MAGPVVASLGASIAGVVAAAGVVNVGMEVTIWGFISGVGKTNLWEVLPDECDGAVDGVKLDECASASWGKVSKVLGSQGVRQCKSAYPWMQICARQRAAGQRLWSRAGDWFEAV